MRKISTDKMSSISGGFIKCIYITMGSVLLAPFSVIWANSQMECFMNTHQE